MAEMNPREMQQALAQPFAPEDLEWRIQTTSKDKTRGMAVPYVTNRAIQTRLDEVCGPDNWYNDFKPWHANGKKESQLCGMDQMTNKNVRDAILTMRKEVKKIPGIRYSKYTWNPAYKGVDDYLLSRVAAM